MDTLLGSLTSSQWKDMFSEMENQAKSNVSNRKKGLVYRYLGELDCPEEAFSEFATVNDVNNAMGKTNWFICSDGTFYTCGDCEVDLIFESGHCTDMLFPFEEERADGYAKLSKDERIQFRINLQGLDKTKAKEIVCYELDIPAYDYAFVFTVEDELLNSITNEKETKSYCMRIEADSINDAEEKLTTQLIPVGSIVEEGTRFTKEDNKKMRELGTCLGYHGGTKFSICLTNRKINVITKLRN